MAPLLSITDLRRAALEARTAARVHGQIQTVLQKETQQRKPFWELTLADAEARLLLRAWSDSPSFKQCAEMEPGGFLEIEGEFSSSSSFGLEAKTWTCRSLEDEEIQALLGGPAPLREKQAADFAFLEETVAALADPRLKALCQIFLADFGERFRRAAGARTYHHARRGGLVEHTAQMMRAATALAGVYSALNRDLLIAGVLLHDAGKMWENSLPAGGFIMPYDERAELVGHISIGVDLLNSLWRKLEALPEFEAWRTLAPPPEDVRLHLVHLILSHHGELQFGSPVTPKTPEAHTLHYLDNLDAKLEMVYSSYRTAKTLAPRVYEKVWPLPGNSVAPLPAIVAGTVLDESPAPGAD